MEEVHPLLLSNEKSFINKNVLIRIDTEVSVDSNNAVLDDGPLKASLSTINAVRERGGKVILLGSRGSPTSKRDSELTLLPVAKKLGELLKIDVPLIKDFETLEAASFIKEQPQKSVLLLENLRFSIGEVRNDIRFSKEIASLGHIFLQDNFSITHLPHASVIGIPKILPSGLGFSAGKDLQQCTKFFASKIGLRGLIIGGALLSTKIDAILSLAPMVDRLIIGGGAALSLLAAQGIQVGRSLCEHSLTAKVMEIFATYSRKGSIVYSPVDVMVASSPQSLEMKRESTTLEIPPDLGVFDIGPATTLLFRQAIRNLDSVLWMGPMGTCEGGYFSEGTSSLIESLSMSHASILALGASTAQEIAKSGQTHKFNHISRASVAAIELAKRKSLQGIELLSS